MLPHWETRLPTPWPSQSLDPANVLISPYPVLLMMNAGLASDKYSFFKWLVWLDWHLNFRPYDWVAYALPMWPPHPVWHRQYRWIKRTYTFFLILLPSVNHLLDGHVLFVWLNVGVWLCFVNQQLEGVFVICTSFVDQFKRPISMHVFTCDDRKSWASVSSFGRSWDSNLWVRTLIESNQ